MWKLVLIVQILVLWSVMAPATWADDFYIFPATTPLQKSLLGSKTRVYVVVHGPAFLEDDGKPAAKPIAELRTKLKAYVMEKSGFKIRLFFPHGRGRGNEYQILRKAMRTLGDDLKFEKVTVSGTWRNDEVGWEETIAPLTKPYQRGARGQESPVEGKRVRTYPVRTNLSRELTGGADCMVDVLQSVSTDQAELDEKLAQAIRKQVKQLKLSKKHHVRFRFRAISGDRKTAPASLGAATAKIAAELGFSGSSFSF